MIGYLFDRIWCVRTLFYPPSWYPLKHHKKPIQIFQGRRWHVSDAPRQSRIFGWRDFLSRTFHWTWKLVCMKQNLWDNWTYCIIFVAHFVAVWDMTLCACVTRGFPALSPWMLCQNLKLQRQLWEAKRFILKAKFKYCKTKASHQGGRTKVLCWKHEMP